MLTRAWIKRKPNHNVRRVIPRTMALMKTSSLSKCVCHNISKCWIFDNSVSKKYELHSEFSINFGEYYDWTWYFFRFFYGIWNGTHYLVWFLSIFEQKIQSSYFTFLFGAHIYVWFVLPLLLFLCLDSRFNGLLPFLFDLCCVLSYLICSGVLCCIDHAALFVEEEIKN